MQGQVIARIRQHCYHMHALFSSLLDIQEMGNLSVRKLDEETMKRLRIRAAEHGVSMEEEARRILSQAVAAPASLGDLAVKLFGQTHGIDLELPDRKTHEPLILDN